MNEVRQAEEIKDIETLDMLYDAIHKENISDEELSAAVGAVLAQGKLIVDLEGRRRNDG